MKYRIWIHVDDVTVSVVSRKKCVAFDHVDIDTEPEDLPVLVARIKQLVENYK